MFVLFDNFFYLSQCPLHPRAQFHWPISEGCGDVDCISDGTAQWHTQANVHPQKDGVSKQHSIECQCSILNWDADGLGDVCLQDVDGLIFVNC